VIVFVRQLGDKEYSFIWNGWMKIAVFEGLNVVEWVWIYGTSCSICTLRLKLLKQEVVGMVFYE